MGQALRRATGSMRAPPPPTPPVRSPPPPPPAPSPTAGAAAAQQDRLHISDGEATTTKDGDGILEERDPSYDEMLKHMVGKVRSKPGGKLEMGEAFVVERYNKPLPKLRSSKSEGYEQKTLPPGTLSIEHVHQIILLHQGKSNDHQGPMSIEQIAEKFRTKADVVRNIVHSVSLPQEDVKKTMED